MSQATRPTHVPGSFALDLRSFGRLFTYATSTDKALMVLGAIAALCAGATLPLLSVIFGRVVDHFNIHSPPGNETKNNLVFSNSTNSLSIYILYLFLLKLSLGYFSTFVFRMAGIRISSALRTRYLEAIFKQSVRALDELSPGYVVECLGQCSDAIQAGINEKLALLVQSGALILSGFIVAMIHCWSLSLAMMSGSVVILVQYYLFLKFQGPLEVELGHTAGETSIAAYEIIRNIFTIKSLNAENAAHLWYQKLNDKSKRIAIRMAPWVAMQSGLVLFALHGSLALGLWLGIRLHLQGSIGRLSDIVIAFSCILLVAGQLGSLFNHTNAIIQAAAASAALFRIIDAPQIRIEGSVTGVDLSKADIVFENVNFAYPNCPDRPVLRDLNLRIAWGQTNALVGRSGCGKSTVVALLERWYHPCTPATQDTEGCPNQQGGMIRANEHDVTLFGLKWWRSQIGLVQQEPVLFNDTILSNVAFGLMGTPWEAESEATKCAMVKEACRTALVDPFVVLLPDGYRTQVGEGGIQLSGGQKQLLAIARAIIKRPSILILDEATSAVDIYSERIVQEALDQAARGRTTLVITHRLSTIKRFEHINFMRDGHIEASGNHAKLMADVAQYALMVETQQIQMPEAKKFGTSGRMIEQNNALQVHTNAPPALTPPYGGDCRRRLPWILQIGARCHMRSSGGSTGWHSLWSILREQRPRFGIIHLTILVAVCSTGAALALQPFVLGHYLLTFRQPRSGILDGSFWALMMFVLALALLVSSGALAMSVKILSAKMAAQISSMYFANVVKKEISWFDHEHRSCGALIAQLSNDPRQLQQLFGVGLSMPLLSVLLLIGCYLLAFSQGWKMSLVVAAAAVPSILGATFVRFRYELTFTKSNSKLFFDSSMFASEAIGAFRTVTSLTLEGYCLERYNKLLDQHVLKAFRQARIACLVFALSDSMDMLCIALTIYYGGELVARQEYETLQFFIIYYALIQGSQAAGQHLAYIGLIGSATEAATRIVDMNAAHMSEAVEQHDEELATPHPKSLALANLTDLARGLVIEVKDVTFQYPSRNTAIFSSLSFSVDPGEFIGVVGPSGCGKTTILSLLSRMYPVTKGEILIGGVPIRSIPGDIFRRMVSVVRQEPALLPGSILENLTFGLPDGHAAMQEESEKACQLAGIHDYVCSLPHGYDTKLEPGRDSGLSGGQKQRLCIARALLRQPRILLLDEVTSNLDSSSEAAIKGTIEYLSVENDMTILVVTHRLSLIQNAHRIIVLGKDGKLVEEGTHRDLVSKRGMYWSMCLAQHSDS